ncbi:MAG: NADH-dependent [FeFe] hydrogenase, group A6 [Leptospiraceae bacterium]|nr:NADH-dependent [FeFe] hydrogenase, group A6 [Leptospiraceae bacterium]MDW8306952.1 NADH-dependent [FeFe] hydrogenase, group A6 [Leptospiraceae bacterium]
MGQEKYIHCTINGIPCEVVEGSTILEAAQQIYLKIPTLCKHPDLVATGACGICIVRVKGMASLPRACTTPVEEGMEIITHDEEIVNVRKTVLELILSTHPNSCLTCGRNQSCELQQLASDFAIRESAFAPFLPNLPVDRSTGSLIFEFDKCIKCGRCVYVCQEMQGVWALSFLNRGMNTRMAPAGDIELAEAPCVRCGQCSAHCPTGAIIELDETAEVWQLLHNPDYHVVVQIAPSVRVTVGEEFGFPPGTNLTGQIYAVLRRLGFDAIFDTNFAADVTIMEEASEFVERFVHDKGILPLITSCCPSWVDFMEKMYPDFIPHFSSTKSPQQILGVLAKTYYSAKKNIDPSRIKVISIMPCTAKKYELTRSHEMYASGYKDVDIALTTRELARMIRQSGIDFAKLPPEKADSILGEYSGAGTAFGYTGGVMEAALRTAQFFLTGSKMPRLEFAEIRGLKGVKEASLNFNGKEIRVAVAHGLGHVSDVLERVREAKARGEILYHFIEVMACPGGCIGGGGQPYGITNEVRKKRIEGLYQDDRSQKVRCSHENEEVQELYRSFLEKPLSEKAHQLLHTTYHARPIYRR